MINSKIDLDASDIAILKVLQQQGRISNVELAERVHLSPPATLTRLKRLEKQGLIDRFVAVLNRHKTGHDTLGFIQLTLSLHQHQQIVSILDTIVAMPEVLECHNVTGEYDYLLKVVLENTQGLEAFISKKLIPMQGLARVHTSLVLKEYKSTTELNLDH
ncbi:Lrp/AsnC family transcriptional regulator [Pleionea mediterranea]|jgi:Lrp/AsnC family leucine-responsive transcriptional regulator|uniref:DNA-binding Lrp family transcriptional regulator n=1 Tax=Pleionea mediterranea TaxID=523701 RepID=A0A316FFV1_9GAMM|nr:Lrp/AsnC family transcriptional regulator [Pleionea mediterranea]PWK47811.1 DNA-binding Lrp family transcriptional regulator [Pleionea mediterranea]